MIRLEIRVNCEWVTLMTPSGTINLVTLATRVPKIMKMMTNEKDDGNGDAEIKSQLSKKFTTTTHFSSNNENES